MSKHTKGPWNANCREHLIGDPYPGLWSTRVNGAHKGAVANSIGLDEAECDANARLIAAAPELLAALRMFVLLDPRCHHGVEHCGECATCLGQAAIAKAEGTA